MDYYEKYNKINENIEVFKLSDADVLHFRNMVEHLNELREKESIGELTSEEKGQKERAVFDLDSFVNTIIQDKKNKIEEEIDKFRRNVITTKKKLEKIREDLVLGIAIDVNLPEMIKELGNEIEGLAEEARSLIASIDEFKSVVNDYDTVELTTNYNEIQENLKKLRDLLKQIKQKQIDLYNARVSSVNKEIDQIKNLTPEELDKLPAEVRERIAELHTLSSCDIEIREYKNLKYMNELDYTNLVKTILEITKIKTAMGIQEKSEMNAELDAEIDQIEEKIQEIEGKIYDGISKEEIEELDKEIANVSMRTVEFELKTKGLQEKLGEKYNEYFSRVNDAQANLAELSGRLKGLVVENRVEKDYAFYSEKLNLLEGEVNDYASLVESLYGKVLMTAIETFEVKYNTLNGRLDEIEKDIEQAYEDKKLDQNQYEQLKQQIERIKKTLEDTKAKYKNPEMAKDVDVFSFLNGQISGIEAAINQLEILIGDDKIKDRKVRKEIDKTFVAIEKEILDIEKFLEKYKGENPEKYEEEKARLEGLKDRLDKLGKKYRKNCPLLVRAAKSAKDFYKKHKKLCLIVAGLAAVALVHATVGPILIPAIMHGNIMIGQTAPALSGFTSFVNNILGGMIGATQKTSGMWLLANGVRITPNMASTSLLKGLAISGLGSAALLAPLTAGAVVGIKKLMAKIKNKEKTTEKKEEIHVGRSLKDKAIAGKNKIKDGKDKIKEKISNMKNKRKNPDKETFKDFEEILKDIRKSGMSVDDYCKEHELTEEDKVVLAYFIAKSNQKEQEKQEAVKRSGR